MTSTLTRERLLKPAKRRYDYVDLADGRVRIRSMTTGEMRALRASMLDRRGELNRKRSDRLRELLICKCACDDDGNLLLTEDDALGTAFDEIDGAVTTQLFIKCKAHTGFTEDEDFQAIEDAVKNSAEGNGQPSSSDLPSASGSPTGGS